ncbi:MAG: carboxypeptidase-like regulatory domain-containing protein [Bacteroidia bacterium]
MKNIFLLVLVVLAAQTLSAQQTYTLSGYVKEAGSKELLLGVTIYTADKTAGTVTNDFGYYALQLPVGTHDIVYNFIGYGTEIRQITISADKVQNVLLQSANSTLGEVVIKASKTQKKVSEQVQMSTIEIPIKTIKDIPALMG